MSKKKYFDDKNEYGFIYLFTICGKGYVGQTPHLKKRFKQHFSKNNPNSYFHNSLRKYFFENGSFAILECWKRSNRPLKEFRDLLDNREIFWIDKLKTFDPEQKEGWNLTKGGGGKLGRCGSQHPMWGKTHTKETRNKISIKVKGENSPMWGKHHSEETKKLISEARQGKYVGKNSPNWGKHPSKETKKLMSEAKQGKYKGETNPMWGKQHSKESRKKMSEIKIGHCPSEKTRKKMSESRIGEKNSHAKLTEEQVIKIKKSILTNKELAKIYNVGNSMISKIKLGQNWKHIK